MSARLLFSLCLLISIQAQAQLYKWVEADGKKNYSDKPPPESVKRIETKSMPASEKSAALPYQLARAVNTMPVTLYSADKVSQSADARNFLMKHGIPFSEKTISSNDDIDKFIQISGSAQVPVLFIGRTKLTGFNPGEWRATLTQAGYPESNVLPANYPFSVPQPLVSAAMAPVQLDAKNSAQLHPTELPARDPNGFRF